MPIWKALLISLKAAMLIYLVKRTKKILISLTRNVKNALNGDRVKIYLYARHQAKRMEGEVVVGTRASEDGVCWNHSGFTDALPS